jgi:hypothetical protein
MSQRNHFEPRYPLTVNDTNVGLPKQSEVDPAELRSTDLPERLHAPNSDSSQHRAGNGQGRTAYAQFESPTGYEFIIHTNEQNPRDITLSVNSERVLIKLDCPSTHSSKSKHNRDVDEEKDLATINAKAANLATSTRNDNKEANQLQIPSENSALTLAKSTLILSPFPGVRSSGTAPIHFSFALPPDADTSHAEVHYSEKQGLLKVTMPRIVRMLELRINNM